MKTQSSNSNKPIGQTLIEAGLISINQIEIALKEQKETGLRIGEILVAHGWIKQSTINFFVEEWQSLLEDTKRKPLVYYFQQADLLDAEQISAIVCLQKLKQKKVRFHHLVVEQGYIQDKTVNFFLAYLFNIHDPKSILIANPYQVLRTYAQGIRNFSGIDLRKTPMTGVSLREIILNGSNLSKIDLSKANLSHSSLIRVNLNLANLNQAILTQVNLTSSFLTKANFQEAHLEKANFTSAILHSVNFQEAHLAKANFSRADLTKARLPLDYPYDVYYDRHTIFDYDFNPQSRGWKEVNK